MNAAGVYAENLKLDITEYLQLSFFSAADNFSFSW